MFKQPKPRAIDQDDAESIGLQALGFLAADSNRIAKFLSLTGIAPDDLFAQARTAPLLAAVLEHLAADESLLLVFTAEAGIPPEQIGAASRLLQGG